MNKGGIQEPQGEKDEKIADLRLSLKGIEEKEKVIGDASVLVQPAEQQNLKEDLKLLREKSKRQEKFLTEKAELSQLKGKVAFLERELHFAKREQERGQKFKDFYEIDMIVSEDWSNKNDCEKIDFLVSQYANKVAELRLQNLKKARQEMKIFAQGDSFVPTTNDAVVHTESDVC